MTIQDSSAVGISQPRRAALLHDLPGSICSGAVLPSKEGKGGARMQSQRRGQVWWPSAANGIRYSGCNRLGSPVGGQNFIKNNQVRVAIQLSLGSVCCMYFQDAIRQGVADRSAVLSIGWQGNVSVGMDRMINYEHDRNKDGGQ
jgi:hypothetical protein